MHASSSPTGRGTGKLAVGTCVFVARFAGTYGVVTIGRAGLVVAARLRLARIYKRVITGNAIPEEKDQISEEKLKSDISSPFVYHESSSTLSMEPYMLRRTIQSSASQRDNRISLPYSSLFAVFHPVPHKFTAAINVYPSRSSGE